MQTPSSLIWNKTDPNIKLFDGTYNCNDNKCEMTNKGKYKNESDCQKECGDKPQQSTEQPRNWMDILLKIGLGVCIFALLIMIYKLVFSDSDSLLGNSNEETMKKDDFTIFPGLFDEPLTLFERGNPSESEKNKEELKNINKSITEINDEITKIRLDLPCDKKNLELYNLTQQYSEEYKTKEERESLGVDRMLEIDREIQQIWIDGSESGCKIDGSKNFILIMLLYQKNVWYLNMMNMMIVKIIFI